MAALIYTLYTLVMMTIFGVEKWCQTGEVFSVYFGMFSQLGPSAYGMDGSAGGCRCPPRRTGPPFPAPPPW